MDLVDEHIDLEAAIAGGHQSVNGHAIGLVLQRVRLRARRRIAWLRNIWQENGHANAKDHMDAHSEVDGYLQNVDTPLAEAEWYSANKIVGVWNEALAEVERAIHNDRQSRLALLTQLFALNAGERDLLEACIAIAIDPNFGRIYAYLQDHSRRGYVTSQLVARLFEHGLYLPLGAGSPMKVWGLVTETETGLADPARLECDAFIQNWLLGRNDPAETLMNAAGAQAYHEPLTGWPVAETLQVIHRIVDGPTKRPLRLFVAGAPGAGRSSFAACLCHQLGLTLLAIDSDRIPEQRWGQIYMHAQRHAFLNNCALAWRGGSVMERYCPTHIPPFPIQFVIGEVDESVLPATDLVDHRVELPALSLEGNLRLWQTLIPESLRWPEPELQEMIRRHPVHIGTIVSVAHSGITDIREASEAIRASSRLRLGSLAQQMNGAYQWEDLILPDWLRHQLEDLAYEAGNRSQLWERPDIKKLFPQGRGLFALFSGTPGTGKTMAAQVIANALQLDLFRVDLSTMVSKYVGETSKNIERILSRAQRMDIVLLFDEADALFGKRTDVKDAHDRFANTDTNYLLQAIEQYPGVVILTSNKKANIDGGFIRRLRYVLEFQKPDVSMRLQLWRRLTAALAGPEAAGALDKGLVRLAEMVETSGAQIKFSLLSAVFIAQREGTGVTMKHILAGLEREMTKEGRGLGTQVKTLLKEGT